MAAPSAIAFLMCHIISYNMVPLYNVVHYKFYNVVPTRSRRSPRSSPAVAACVLRARTFVRDAVVRQGAGRILLVAVIISFICMTMDI
jgi:hypothetical protein